MFIASARLEAVGGRARRYYEIEIAVDLLGDHVVVVRHGRIGTQSGREWTRAFPSLDAARSEARSRLVARNGSSRRCGASYAVVASDGAWEGITPPCRPARLPAPPATAKARRRDRQSV